MHQGCCREETLFFADNGALLAAAERDVGNTML